MNVCIVRVSEGVLLLLLGEAVWVSIASLSTGGIHTGGEHWFIAAFCSQYLESNKHSVSIWASFLSLTRSL